MYYYYVHQYDTLVKRQVRRYTKTEHKLFILVYILRNCEIRLRNIIYYNTTENIIVVTCIQIQICNDDFVSIMTFQLGIKY